MRRLWPLATLALLQACSNCGGAPTEAPSRYLAKTAEMAVEIPDLAALATRKAAIVAKLEGVATKEQVDLAVLELKRTLTFDPTTVEGLEAAGLPKKGAVAVEVIDSGRGALWVVPVGNKEKLQATLDELVKSRMRAEETKEEAVEGGKVKVHYGTFGPEKVVVGAHAFVSGFVLVGVGPKALDSVKGALARKKEDSLLLHPEYAPLVASLGEPMVRALVPSGKETAAKLAAAMDLPTDGLAASVTSVGWALALDDKALAVNLRMRFDEAGKKTIATILAPKGEAPAGVRAVYSPDAVFTLAATGDVDALIKTLAPPGSPTAAELDTAFARLKEELGVDMREQLAALTGHLAVAVGLADIKMIANIRELMMNPARAMWSTASTGMKAGADKAMLFGSAADPQLAARGLQRTTRKVGERDVAVLAMTTPMEGQDPVLMEMWSSGAAWSVSNAAARTAVMIADEAKPHKDPLDGKPGLALTVQVLPVTKALRTLDIDALAGGGAEAMLVKGFLTKALTILDRLERLEVRGEPTTDGLGATARLVFATGAAPAGAAK